MSDKSASTLRQIQLMVIATVILMLAVYHGAVKPQQATVRGLASELADVYTKRESIRTMAMSVDTNRALLKSIILDKQTNEVHMASGDVYFWMVRLVEGYKESHGIEFNRVEPPQTEPSQVLPRVPYGSATFSVAGRTTYASFGSFLADLENEHPLLRLHHLEIEPAAYGLPSPDEEGLVRFLMELQILVKPQDTSE